MDVRFTSLPTPSLDTTKTVISRQPREAAGTLEPTLACTPTQAGRGAEVALRQDAEAPGRTEEGKGLMSMWGFPLEAQEGY